MRVVVLLLSLALVACAEADNEEFRETLEKRLNKSFQDVEVTSVSEAPMGDLYEVKLNGRESAWVTRDGRYLFSGPVFELSDQGAENLKERRFRKVRREGLDKIDLDRAITFAAEDEKAEVFVFTDVTCGYCRRLHQGIEAINQSGITVHYLAYPRGGMEARGAKLMQQVWCAEDRKAALTEAKATGSLKQSPQKCDDPVKEHYKTGVEFGVRGTPAIFTPEGKKLGGYLPPGGLARALGVSAGGSGEIDAPEQPQ